MLQGKRFSSEMKTYFYTIEKSCILFKNKTLNLIKILQNLCKIIKYFLH